MKEIMDKTYECELVAKMIAGDEDAFCDLYAKYKERLIYYALRFIKSSDFAEDIFQDAFASIWQNRRFIDPQLSFSSYLYTIIRNRIFNELRAILSEEELKQHIVDHAVNIESNTPEKMLQEKNLSELVDEALEKLSPRQREIFELSRIEQLSYREIALRTGLSVNTVGEYISTSLQHIRSYLSKYKGELYVDLILLLVCLNY